mmetsp:Transcript_10669/g.20399  ORF Transcript_10669/g.20399 Transcript_10669/m.20399 type:complete len:219 (+) Transcript_10669:436-1092(+)
MVTTTMGMLDGVHGNTTDLRPLVTLDAVLVVSTASLEERLVHAATASDHADHGTALGVNGLLHARGKTDLGLASVLVVADDSDVLARGAGEGATVTRELLDVARDGTLGHLVQGKDVANYELGLLAVVDKLASVHALSADHQLLVGLETVGVAEGNAGHRGTTSGVVEDLLDDTLDVAVALREVKRAHLGGALAVRVVRLEDGAGGALTLGPDHTPHG